MSTRSRFNRLVILDSILLIESHWKILQQISKEVIVYSRRGAEEILGELHRVMDEDPKPLCWTQLAQEAMSEDRIRESVRGADAIVTCWAHISDRLILENPQLKYIGFWTNIAGHRINLDLAKRQGICVTLIPDYGTDAVAELAIGGMLAVSRRLLSSHRNTLRGKWPYELLKTGNYVPAIDEIPQRTLKGKSIGIVGFGRIGKRVSVLARAFGMKVSYWSKRRRPAIENEGIEFRDLVSIFRECDFISLHLSPSAPAGIVNASLLREMKQDATLVNTSWGGLVDQESLFRELKSGRIHAFLDVYEGLPPRDDLKEVAAMGNVFTYRSGWYTRESLVYKGERLIDQMKQYLNGSKTSQVSAEDLESRLSSEVPCNGGR